MEDVFVMKLTKDGATWWNRLFGDTSWDWGSCIAASSNGSHLITGGTFTSPGSLKCISTDDAGVLGSNLMNGVTFYGSDCLEDLGTLASPS